jgi:hypothetical protein
MGGAEWEGAVAGETLARDVCLCLGCDGLSREWNESGLGHGLTWPLGVSRLAARPVPDRLAENRRAPTKAELI